MYKKTTLKNGLRIITVPRKETKTVAVLLLVKTGSKYEVKKMSGISHLTEHMIFKGTKNRKTSRDVVETIDRIGGIYNAFTGEEYTGCYVKVASNFLDIALDWVADIYLNATIPEGEVEKERGAVIEEINMFFDSPMRYINDLLKKLLYGDQPAGWDIAGTRETLKNITRKKILSHIKTDYIAENMVVCAVGDINEGKIVEMIKKNFKNVPEGKYREKMPVIEKQDNPKTLLFFKDTKQTQLALGFRAYNLFHKDKYVLDILSIILGGNMSSRIFTEVREKQGMAYYVETVFDSDTDTGMLISYAGVDNRKVMKSVTSILNEYNKIKEKKVSNKELLGAKNYLKGKMSIVLEDSNALGRFYGNQELLKGEILTIKEIFSKIDKVSKEDILRVARDVMVPEKLNLALIGPFKNKKDFEKELLKF